MIPFKKTPGQSFHTNFIVNIVPDDFICFNTKKRAPQEIVFETVDMEEMREDMGYFDGIERKNSVESSDGNLSELTDIRSESVEEIEKDMFQGLAKWAQIKKKEELSNHNLGIIRRLLSLLKKHTSADSLGQYSIHQFDQLVQQATICGIDLKRCSIVTQSSNSPDKLGRNGLNFKIRISEVREKQNHPEKQQQLEQQFEDNLIAFSDKFPEGSSLIKRVIHFVLIKLIDLKFLKQTNVNHISKIHSIYKYLYYDVIENTVFQEDPDRQLKEVQFPRVFGLREASPFRILKSYQLRPFIIKGGDDLRQELLAMNIIEKFQEIFLSTSAPLFLRPYEIIVESDNSGFIEFLPNTQSLDGLKKMSGFKNLNDSYKRIFGEYFLEAQKNFIESLAGHIIHIDFGFILSTSPGGIKFETAHFKLTSEYADLMGGRNSDQFEYFKSLLVRGFLEIKKHVDTICNFVQIRFDQSSLPCFAEFDMIQFRGRLKENFTDKEVITIEYYQIINVQS